MATNSSHHNKHLIQTESKKSTTDKNDRSSTHSGSKSTSSPRSIENKSQENSLQRTGNKSPTTSWSSSNQRPLPLRHNETIAAADTTSIKSDEGSTSKQQSGDDDDENLIDRKAILISKQRIEASEKMSKSLLEEKMLSLDSCLHQNDTTMKKANNISYSHTSNNVFQYDEESNQILLMIEMNRKEIMELKNKVKCLSYSVVSCFILIVLLLVGSIIGYILF